MNLAKLVAAAAALSFVAIGAADAKQKRHKVRHGGVAYYTVAPHWAGTPRPPWAQPWECFTDEGYGRYRSCSSGRR